MTAVSFEDNNRFSLYQVSLLKLTFIYLLFNMLIVPGFAASALTNLYQVFSVGWSNTSSLFQQIFVINSGDFLIILIIQQAAGSIFAQLTSIIDIITYYCSTSYLFEAKMVASSQKHHLFKTDDTVYTFGLYYAQQAVVVGIGIVFQYTSVSQLFNPLG